MKIINLTLIATSFFILTNCGYEYDRYHVGQVWSYDNRPGEENSTLTVVTVENNRKLGVIVGVYIDNLKVGSAVGEFSNLNFLPLSKRAMDKSVTRIKGYTDNLPDYRENYRAWKKTFDENNGKIITKTVKESIEAAESKLQNEFK